MMDSPVRFGLMSWAGSMCYSLNRGVVYFDQLLGACSTQMLVEIHNIGATLLLQVSSKSAILMGIKFNVV